MGHEDKEQDEIVENTHKSMLLGTGITDERKIIHSKDYKKKLCKIFSNALVIHDVMYDTLIDAAKLDISIHKNEWIDKIRNGRKKYC